jgi:hypothetical protein
VHPTLSSHELEGGAQLAGEWNELLRGQRSVFADECGQAGSIEEFEDQVRPIMLEHGAERADQHGMLEPLERLGLRGDRRAGAGISDQMGTEQLGHDRDVHVLVPREVRLVPLASAEELQRASSRRDQITRL